MKIDEQILEELKRYNSINKYILEQDALAPAPAEAPLDTPALPAPAETPAPPAPTPIDVKNDPDVEKLDGDKEDTDSGTEEMDITDLVSTQKNIETKQEEYFNNLTKQLQDLEGKLGEMDNIVNTLNNLEAKIEKYRIKTPEEKLQLRTLDSAPFNKKLTDFFMDKQEDFEKTGKDEYILTQDDIEAFSPNDIKNSFTDFPGGRPPSDYSLR